ncbi:SpoIIE family protein phosphatase [Streptomyces sp. NPDC059224]|uniref:ATP-binding SpoIIE family protein phosphatase n=1 Tax=Streptomyces sp. NPDC059224 TaxID=3346775 RepID=UPI0036C67D85
MSEDAIVVAPEAGPRLEAAAVIDNRGIVTAWSDTAERLLGYDSTESVGKPVWDALAAPLPSTARNSWAARKAWTAAVQATDRKGHHLPLTVRAQPVTGAEGEPLWIITATVPCGFEGLVGTSDQAWARRRLSIINEAGLRIGSTLDLNRTAEELAEVATDHFADFVTVDLLDAVLHGEEIGPAPPAGRLVFRRAAQRSVLEGCPEAVVPIGGLHTYPENSPPGLALATGRSFLYHVDEATLRWWAADAPARARTATTFGIHSVLLVPLRARGTNLGMTFICRHRTADPFDQDDLLMAEDLASRAAVCVDNARRYTRERTTAVTLQRSLLPQRAPEQNALEVATRYIPAGSRAGVGGDWYDVIPLSGARVAMVVGDVVGHGLQASATMGRLRTAVRTLADVDLQPDELLTRLDDVVIRLGLEDSAAHDVGQLSQDDGEISATCLYVVYDPVSCQCTLASAGHLLPVLVTPDGVVEFPDMPVGPPLGVGGLPFDTTTFALPEGSVIMLYTDGLAEALNRDLDTGQNLIADVLGNPSQSLEETCDLLLHTLVQGRPTDDIALLLARTRALDATQVATWDLAADPAVVAGARRHASHVLAEWDVEDASFVTELVVSELVTNAIRYGGAPIQLRLIRDASLICEVSDGSGTAPHLRRARDFDEGGRGLLLVAHLTDRWGARQTPAGKIIWAEQALPATGMA